MNTDDTSGVTRRRVLAGALTTGVAAAGAGAGTFALFSDAESSTENTVQAGTLDLVLDEGDSWTLPVTGLAPGDGTSGSLELSNSGTIDGHHLEIATSVSNNDVASPGEYTTDEPASSLAKNLHVTELDYPTDDFFTAATQVPGAYVYDVDGDGVKGLRITSDRPDNSKDGVVHVSSGGTTTNDYARSLVDVSEYGFTVSELANGTCKYYYYPADVDTTEDRLSRPDEVKLVIEDSDGNAGFLYQHVGPTGTDGMWNERDVSAELAEGTTVSNANGWYEVNLEDGSRVDLGDSPVDEYGDATVQAFGFGAGNFSDSSSVLVDIYYGGLELSDGNTTVEPAFRSTPMSVYDLTNTTIDNLPAPGSGETFSVGIVLDRDVGNAFQGDGVDVTFEFGLAQEDGQDVL